MRTCRNVSCTPQHAAQHIQPLVRCSLPKTTALACPLPDAPSPFQSARTVHQDGVLAQSHGIRHCVIHRSSGSGRGKAGGAVPAGTQSAPDYPQINPQKLCAGAQDEMLPCGQHDPAAASSPRQVGSEQTAQPSRLRRRNCRALASLSAGASCLRMTRPTTPAAAAVTRMQRKLDAAPSQMRSASCTLCARLRSAEQG